MCPLQISGQTIERSVPKFPILFDPANRLLHRLCFQFQLVDATIAPASKQPGLLEHAQMFRHRRQRHRVRPSQIGYASVALGEMGEAARPMTAALIELWADEESAFRFALAAAVKKIDPRAAAKAGIR